MKEYAEMFEKIFNEKKNNKNLNNKNQIEEDLNDKINLIANLQKIFDVMPDGVKSAEIIKALKPLLSDELQQKADEAVKMLKIFNVIPELKEKDILN